MICCIQLSQLPTNWNANKIQWQQQNLYTITNIAFLLCTNANMYKVSASSWQVWLSWWFSHHSAHSHWDVPTLLQVPCVVYCYICNGYCGYSYLYMPVTLCIALLWPRSTYKWSTVSHLIIVDLYIIYAQISIECKAVSYKISCEQAKTVCITYIVE